MALTHRDRFRLKSQLIDILGGDEWPLDRVNLLLGEFGIEQIDDDWQGPGLADVISGVSDETLTTLYAVALDVDDAEVESVVESAADMGRWKSGYVRLFISHSAKHRDFVGRVADQLAVVGVHGFVAHDTMEYTKPWQDQIEQALRSMQALVVVGHPEVNDSTWCQQEIGWALGRRVPIFVVRMGIDPSGFIGRSQWPSGYGQQPAQVAETISGWIAGVPELGDSMVEGLLNTLADVKNYVDAGAAASRLAALGTLTDEQFTKLSAVYWTNDQLFGGVLPTRELAPFYRSNGREWPPPRS